MCRPEVFERVVALCKEFQIYLVHDLAYADIVFDGYKHPRFCRCREQRILLSSFSPYPRATICPAGELFYGGQSGISAALGRLKSYFDYGTFTPIQVASILALEDRRSAYRKSATTTASAVMSWSKDSIN